MTSPKILNFKKIAILFFCLFASAWCSAQIKRYTLTGTIVDKDKNPLPGASIVLLNPKDSIMIAFGNSDESGKFIIKNVKPQQVKMQVTYVSFGTIEKMIDVAGDQPAIDIGRITMDSDLTLQEVEIKGEFIPIKIKKDTVEYNADAFRVRPNANVEELLKKLPGVEVASDGTVTAQGEQVAKVTVDGKKFFGNDVKMATQNLPADAVKKIQFIDKKSEKAEFSGISDGESEKVMNLQLKDNKKIGTFGDVMAGYGSNNRYESKIMANKFTAKYQAAVLANSNNLSNQGFSFNDYNTFSGGSGFGGRGGNFNLPSVVNFGNFNNGRIQSSTAGLNFYYELSPKVNITTSYFLSDAYQDLKKNTLRDNFLGSANFKSSETTANITDRTNHTINLNLQAKPDTVHRFDLESSVKFSKSISANDLKSNSTTNGFVLLNSNNQKDNNINRVMDYSVRAVYNRRLKKRGRIVTIDGSLGNNLKKDDYYLSSFRVIQSLLDTIAQDQISKNTDANYRIFAEFKEPLGNRNYLGISASMRNNSTYQDKDFLDIDLITNARNRNDVLSALVRNDVEIKRLNLGWTKDHDRYSVNADLTLQASTLRGESEAIGFVPIKKTYPYLLPALAVNLSEKGWRFRYSTSINEPTITQLQPVINNSDPINIYQGNPLLKPEYNHNFNIRYNFFDNFNFRNFFAFVNLRYTQDKIIDASTLSQSAVKSTKPINTSNSQNASLNLNYSSPLKPLGIKTRLYTSIGLNRAYNAINDVLDRVNTITPKAGIDIENIKNEKISIILGYDINHNSNKYQIQSNRNINYTNHGLRATLLANLGKGFMVDCDLNHTIYSKEQFGNNNTITMLGASVSKSVLKNRLIFKLRGGDLLNVGQGVSRNITSTYLEEVTSNAIGRYFLLNATYKLSAFNANKQGANPTIMMR